MLKHIASRCQSPLVEVEVICQRHSSDAPEEIEMWLNEDSHRIGAYLTVQQEQDQISVHGHSAMDMPCLPSIFKYTNDRALT